MGKVDMDEMFTRRKLFSKVGDNVLNINGAMFRSNQRCSQCVSAGMKTFIMYIKMYIYFHFKCISRVLRYSYFSWVASFNATLYFYSTTCQRERLLFWKLGMKWLSITFSIKIQNLITASKINSFRLNYSIWYNNVQHLFYLHWLQH